MTDETRQTRPVRVTVRYREPNGTILPGFAHTSSPADIARLISMAFRGEWLQFRMQETDW